MKVVRRDCPETLTVRDRWNHKLIVRDVQRWYPLMETFWKVDGLTSMDLADLSIHCATDVSLARPYTKIVCLLNPFDAVLGAYSSSLDSQARMKRTGNKVANPFNSAYVDVFITQQLGRLHRWAPCFPRYESVAWGVANEFRFDIEGDLSDMRELPHFEEGEGDLYSLDSRGQIATLYDVPVGVLRMERMDTTLWDRLQETRYRPQQWLSCLFQIAWGLWVAQRRLYFFHNDLHIQNVMCIQTKRKFLTYKTRGRVWKVPTYGWILKFIDFGRSSIIVRSPTGRPILVQSDLLDPGEEAGTQYNWGPKINPHEKIVLPNPSFDWVYFCVSLLELHPGSDSVYEALVNWVRDDAGNPIHTQPLDGFDLYETMARRCHRGIPGKVLEHPIFGRFRKD